MIAFILGEPLSAGEQATRSSIGFAAPDWRVHTAGGSPAETMNAVLEQYGEPYFLTFQAGDRINPSFVSELEKGLSLLGAQHAGMLYRRDNGKGEEPSELMPLVWRTDAVRACGPPFFEGMDRLPFPEYVLHDKRIQLSRGWEWEVCSSHCWAPFVEQAPSWMRKKEQKPLIDPILVGGRLTCPDMSEQGRQPVFSIALCTYNNADYVLWAVRSVLAQTEREWELLILDDGSTDETSEKLAPLQEDNRIRICRFDTNRGKSKVLNQAMQLASGFWLLELDADDWLPPDCLSRLRESIAKASEDTSLLYGNYHEWTERLNKRLVYAGVRLAAECIIEERLLTEGVPIAPRCYRLSALKSLGGWNEEALFGGRLYEDFEILLRLAASFKAEHISYPLYHRRLRTSSITKLHVDRYPEWVSWRRSWRPQD